MSDELNQEVQAPESSESVSLNPEQDREVEAKSDGWDDALDAFNDPTGEETPEVPEVKQEVKTEGDPKSQLEQGKPDILNIDDLKVPHKYKGAVMERLQKVSSQFEEQVQARTQEVAEVRQASAGLLTVFKEIAENPNRMAEYVVKYGDQLGINEDVVRQYAGLFSGQHPPQNQNVGPQQQNTPSSQGGMEEIFNKYADKLVSTSDPKEFVGTLRSMIAETSQNNTREMMDSFKNILLGYHEQIVNPNLQTIKEAEQHAVSQNQVSAWNTAFNSIKGKYSDADKYAPEMKRLLREDEGFSQIRAQLNKTPQNTEKHAQLLERLYIMVSHNDKLQAATAPKPKSTGLPPSTKFISTTKAGGSDWDDPAHKEIWGL